jgi:predicted DCC family thiol-disulfide oxidoreductase YuxK
MPSGGDKLVILYDGVCGLCNRLVRFVLRRDRRDRFRFASLQSAFAGELLRRHGRDPGDLDTLYVVAGQGTAEEHLLARSAAVLHVLQEIGGGWRGTAVFLRLLPRPLRDWAYGRVARSRYRIFGKYDTCPLPTPEERAKFLEI